MHSVPITIPGAPHNFTLTYIHSQLSSFAYSNNGNMIKNLCQPDDPNCAGCPMEEWITSTLCLFDAHQNNIMRYTYSNCNAILYVINANYMILQCCCRNYVSTVHNRKCHQKYLIENNYIQLFQHAFIISDAGRWCSCIISLLMQGVGIPASSAFWCRELVFLHHQSGDAGSWCSCSISLVCRKLMFLHHQSSDAGSWCLTDWSKSQPH